MARKKDKKVLKQKITTKQSQKQSVHIHLGKATTKRKTTSKSITKSSQPIVNVNPVVYSMPSYANELTRLENKISELSSIVRPVKQVKIEEPIKSETKSLAELQEKKIDYYNYQNRFSIPKQLPAEPPTTTAHYTSESESIPLNQPFIRRRGRIPKAKTAEELEAERIARNARKRELYNQKKQQNIKAEEESDI